MRWDVQAASYVRQVEAVEGVRLPFSWFVVQSSEPYSCGIYHMADEWVDYAEQDLLTWTIEWAMWKNEDPVGMALSISDEPVTLQRPPWRN